MSEPQVGARKLTEYLAIAQAVLNPFIQWLMSIEIRLESFLDIRSNYRFRFGEASVTPISIDCRSNV